MQVYAGEFQRIYDPSAGEPCPWYINDHTLVKGEDGWHLFGITHAEPADPLNEVLCAHAFSRDILTEPFRKLEPPFRAEAERGELHFWAPHVIRVDGLYYMFYCAGSLEGHDRYRLHLATSPDLYNWTKHPENPLVIDGFDARDPMVTRIGNKWVMYYTCNLTPQGGNHCVACVTSEDLIHWGDKRVVYTSGAEGTYAGPCESPFVIQEGDKWLLFIGPDRSYNDTAVFASDDPFSFDDSGLVGHIPAHAAEVVTVDGARFITRCGWGEGGVYLAPLHIEA